MRRWKLRQDVREQIAPFDGTCQLCAMVRGSNQVMAQVKYADRDVSKTLELPCVFCDLCFVDFISGLRRGFARRSCKVIVDSLWLLFMLCVFSIIAIALPVIGVVFVFAMMVHLYHHVTRRRANPYLIMHLNQICSLSEALEDLERYVVTAAKPTRILPRDFAQTRCTDV